MTHFILQTFFVYRFSGKTESPIEHHVYRLAWLPDGYAEFMAIEENRGITVLYKNEEGKRLRFSSIYDPNTTEWYIDTSNTIQSKVKINGLTADLFTATNDETASIVMWIDSNENMAFYVSAFLSEEELIRAAESIYGQETT